VQAAGIKPTTSLRPRDPNATAAALRSKVSQSSRPAGVSLSSLLQNRAESAIPKAAVPLSPLPDIDSVDKDNPLAAAEYASSIYDYYRRVEPKFSVSFDYMKSQVGTGQLLAEQVSTPCLQLGGPRLHACLQHLLTKSLLTSAGGDQREDARHLDRLAG
jgi:hypothetical protein